MLAAGPAGLRRVRRAAADRPRGRQCAGVEQAVGSIGRYVIAPGASVTGAPATLPVSARLSLQLNASDAIVSLAFDQDSTAPECEVLAYRPATATERGLLVLDVALLGQSDETPDQQFALPGAPVQGGSLEVYTLVPPAPAAGSWTWRVWELHADFDAAGRGDAWVTADEVAGTVRFGNGNRGLIPPSTALVLGAVASRPAPTRTCRQVR